MADLKANAEAQFKRTQRAAAGDAAMSDYLDNSKALREKTARLKELRLAGEKAAAKKTSRKAKAPKAAKVAKEPKAPRKAAKAAKPA
jgi:hypothetical protein